MLPSKPTVEVTKIQSLDHPVLKLLADQTDDLESFIRFFNADQLKDFRFRTFLVAQLDKCIVGITSVQNSSTYHENAVGVRYVSTHKKYQNLGVATAMVKALFIHAQLEGKAISNSPYELEGEIYLQPVMQRVSNKFPNVEFVERDYSLSQTAWRMAS